MTPSTYMARFRYRKGPPFIDGWRISETGDCGAYALSVAYYQFGGWLGMIWAVLTGQCVFWWCWSGKWYPSHVVLWVNLYGWTDSSNVGWRHRFDRLSEGRVRHRYSPIFTNQTRFTPLTLGPIPYAALAALVYTDWWWPLWPLTAVVALWVVWVPSRVLTGLLWKGVR